jgi:anaerobic ribonucleoside-triphosphate reductase activating protein
MLKYTTNQVTFSEVPDEISLCINISNCPHHCAGCHSQELWGDIGEPLTETVIEDLLTSNRGVTCVCFMGGDAEPTEVNRLSKWVHEHYDNAIRTAWYSGERGFPRFTPDFDYVKIGPYIEELGPLNVKTTNQKMVKIHHNPVRWYMEDITYKFWKNDTDS